MSSQKKYLAKAFVSCSLRKQDKPFNDFICKVLRSHGIKPFGTVGLFSVSPENPVELMKKNVPLADMVVICATPRYFQKDLTTGKISNGVSEMIQVESGMAFASEKPVIVFAQKGTDLGSFIPNITQYIELDETNYINNENIKKIKSLFKNAIEKVQTINATKGIKITKKVTLVLFAMYGVYKFGKDIFGNRRS